MLVCNVSLRPSRAGIAAGLVEAASAIDTNATGNVVFAALVDDPASVLDRVDAYSGEIMREAASAAATVNAGMAYSTGIVAAVTTLDAISATVTAAPTAVLATFDGTATVTTVTNGGLTATHSSATTPSGVRSTQLKTSGKYYFEVTIGATHGATDYMGIILSTATVANPDTGANVTAIYPGQGSAVYSNNGFASGGVGGLVAGNVVGIAIDLDNRKAWFRKNNIGWFNGIGSPDPVTNVGGVNIASGSFAPAVGFLGSGAASGDNFTANFGQSAFFAAAPAGFGYWSV